MTTTFMPIAENFAAKAEALFSTIPQYARAGYTFLSSQVSAKMLEVLKNTKILWAKALPFIKAGVLFCISPLGVSIAVLGLSIIPLGLARSSKSRLATIAWYSLGILIACYGGFLFINSGIIPGLVFKLIL